MSPRQQQALLYIKRHSEEFGRAPYQWQIAAHLKVNSRGYLCRMLDRMQKQGLIRRRYGTRRSIKVTA